MKLEDIGFYTLSDARACNTSSASPLWRCELLLTNRCNFSCPYCRGLHNNFKGEFPIEWNKYIVELWLREGLRNIRFSGGEPTLYDGLEELVRMCYGINGIAISTNGSADFKIYDNLINAGVNDVSVSLDACCAAIGDSMAGNIDGAWDKVVENIRKISERVYTTVGVVFDENNMGDCIETIKFADSLGVSDIRFVPSAQYNKIIPDLAGLSDEILNKYPILNYRITNIKNGRNVRGMSETDSHKCWLALDDMAIVAEYHFPCIIYLREGGDPIGRVGSNMRQERYEWVMNHNTYDDPICKVNCLDVCVDYCNKKERCINEN